MKLIAIIFIFFELSSFSQTFFRQEISESDFRNVTFLQALQNLQRKSQDIDKLKQGFNFVFSEKASKMAEKRLTLSLTQIPLYQAVNYTALTLKLEVIFERKTVVILAPGEKLKNPVTNDKYVKKDPRLLNALRLHCETLSADRTELSEVFDSIKDQSAKADKNGKSINLLNISGSPAKPLLSLKNVSVYEALRYTAIAAGIKMKIDRSAVVFEKK